MPKLDQNLLSVGQMISNGYCLVFKNGACRIYDVAHSEVACISMKEKSFPISWDHAHNVMKASTDETWLWHRRYGHYNLDSLKLSFQKNLVRDLTPIHVYKDICEACQLGKMHRKPFSNEKTWRASQKLELVHTDVCGPMRTPSLSQNRYFILFIDD